MCLLVGRCQLLCVLATLPPPIAALLVDSAAEISQTLC